MNTRELIAVTLSVDQAKINLYAAVSDDFNPIHVDPAYAAQGPMGGIIAHGTMSLNLVWQSLLRSIPDLNWAGVAIDIRFLRPVRLGDTITSGGRIRDEADGGDYAVWVVNQRGEEVISGTLVLGEGLSVAQAAAG